MADEEIPENIDLRFLATQNARILKELAEARTERAELRADVSWLKAESETQSELLGKAMNAALEIAKGQEDILETARLIEGRLFRLEKHAGYAKA